MESLVANAIKSHIENYGLLSPEQHGFVKGHSCVTQLLNVTNSWLHILDTPCPPKIDAIFLDYAKAFDVMPHDVLLDKLTSQYNISGNMWQWIKSFIHGRKQRVVFKGSFSSWLPVSSGVPQGSVLGPLLFNLFINDLPLVTSSTCLLFADDTLLYRPIKSPNDEQQLQHDINQIQLWCDVNKMKLNTKKTKVMRISWSTSVEPNYTLNGTQLDVVSEYKYLGVILNKKLTWDTHVDYVVTKANRMLGFVFSVARHLSSDAFLALYKALVLPIIEYGVPVWHLHTNALIDKIERVQRRATRMILKQRKMQMS